jgi:hypothetical protein
MLDLYVLCMRHLMKADVLAQSILRSSGLAGAIWNPEPEWVRVVRLGQLAGGTQQLRQCRTSHRSPCTSHPSSFLDQA